MTGTNFASFNSLIDDAMAFQSALEETPVDEREALQVDLLRERIERLKTEMGYTFSFTDMWRTPNQEVFHVCVNGFTSFQRVLHNISCSNSYGPIKNLKINDSDTLALCCESWAPYIESYKSYLSWEASVSLLEYALTIRTEKIPEDTWDKMKTVWGDSEATAQRFMYDTLMGWISRDRFRMGEIANRMLAFSYLIGKGEYEDCLAGYIINADSPAHAKKEATNEMKKRKGRLGGMIGASEVSQKMDAVFIDMINNMTPYSHVEDVLYCPVMRDWVEYIRSQDDILGQIHDIMGEIVINLSQNGYEVDLTSFGSIKHNHIATEIVPMFMADKIIKLVKDERLDFVIPSNRCIDFKLHLDKFVSLLVNGHPEELWVAFEQFEKDFSMYLSMRNIVEKAVLEKRKFLYRRISRRKNDSIVVMIFASPQGFEPIEGLFSKV